MITDLHRRLAAPAFLLLALAWTGCEGSPVPLGDPSVPVDEGLLGSWEMVVSQDEEGVLAHVFRFNAVEYFVEYREGKRRDDGSVSFDEMSRLRMYVTDVDGRPFLNVTCIDCDDDDWFFVELERLDADRARLTPPDDDVYENLEDGVTPEAVLSKLRSMRAAGQVGEAAVFRRVPG